jgi:hypothetical protein
MKRGGESFRNPEQKKSDIAKQIKIIEGLEKQITLPKQALKNLEDDINRYRKEIADKKNSTNKNGIKEKKIIGKKLQEEINKYKNRKEAKDVLEEKLVDAQEVLEKKQFEIKLIPQALVISNKLKENKIDVDEINKEEENIKSIKEEIKKLKQTNKKEDLMSKLKEFYDKEFLLDKDLKIISKDYPIFFSFLHEMDLEVERIFNKFNQVKLDSMDSIDKKILVIEWIVDHDEEMIEKYIKGIEAILTNRQNPSEYINVIGYVSNYGLEHQILISKVVYSYYYSKIVNNNYKGDSERGNIEKKENFVKKFYFALENEKKTRKDAIIKYSKMNLKELINEFYIRHIDLKDEKKRTKYNEQNNKIFRLIRFLFPIKHTKALRLFLDLICILLYKTYNINPVGDQVTILDIDFDKFTKSLNKDNLKKLKSKIACSDDFDKSHKELFCRGDLQKTYNSLGDTSKSTTFPQYLVEILSIASGKKIILQGSKGDYRILTSSDGGFWESLGIFALLGYMG